MKKVLFTVFALLFLICSKSYVSAENDMTDISAPEQTVARYFSECYDSFVKLECPDLSDVLDMSIVQCKNKLEVFKEVLDNWKWYIEEKKEPLIVEKLEYGLSFKDVVIEGDTATVTADLSCGEKGTAYWDDEGAHSYPHFMTFGINRFVLKNENGRWLIISHDNDSYGYDFDMSREEEYHYDKAELDRNREEVPEDTPSLENNRQKEIVSRSDPFYVDENYTASRAVSYANTYAVNANTPTFYVNGSLDCTNFVSQCLAYGFGGGGSMTSLSNFRRVLGSGGWFGDSGGGSPAWETVSTLWTYVHTTSNNGPKCTNVSLANVAA